MTKMAEKLDFLTAVHLATTFQKFLLNDEAYVHINVGGSACLDGWIWNLTDEELEAMDKVRKVVRPDD